MQLSEAIDGWLAAHSAGLSMSTRRDIADIAASADRCGYAWMDCIDVRERHRTEIVADADAHSSLNASAIGQFLEIAVEWALTQAETAKVRNDLLPSDTAGWLDADAPRVVDDLRLDEVSWVDELPPVDDLDVDNDGELDPLDQDQFFEVEDVTEHHDDTNADADAEELDAEDPEQEPVEPAVDELIDEDDFDDAELAEIDEDLSTTDEDDLDEAELDDIDHDLAALLEEDAALLEEDIDDDLFDAEDHEPLEPSRTGSAFATATAAGAPADPAASSFLRTLEQTGQTPAVFGSLASDPTPTDLDRAAAASPASVPAIDTEPGGIFSEAAQYDGERSIDWVTVAYFAVAAICFALVIYFYLSS